MKALSWGFRTPDYEAQKSRNPQTTIAGASVYMSQVFKALLKYGTYDRIFLAPVPLNAKGDIRESALFELHKDRVEFVAEHEMHRLASFDRVVFFTPFAYLQNDTRLRRLSGCPAAPITGMIHSMNYPEHMAVVTMLLLAALEEHDALMCSSTAGRVVMGRLLDLVADRLQQAGGARVVPTFKMPIVPLGVEVADFESADDGGLRSSLGLGDGPVVLYLGRLSSNSKADLYPLIVAFQQLHAAQPNVSLVVAGDDTQFGIAPALTEFAARFAPAAPVRVIPNPAPETKRKIFAMADVFVSPADSLQETFGISVVEAMAAGLPAVVADWDGYKDLVTSGETGFRVRTSLPSYDAVFDDLRGSGGMLTPDLLAATTIVDVHELVGGLAALTGDVERRRRMGEAARREAKRRFDWPVIIAAYEALWEELAAIGQRRPAGATRPDLGSNQFRYAEVFADYPTEFLPADRIVRLSRVPQSEALLEWLAAGTNDMRWFRTEVFREICESLRRRERTTIAELLASLEGTEQPLQSIRQTSHLCRLIKYGLVETVSDAELDSPRR